MADAHAGGQHANRVVTGTFYDLPMRWTSSDFALYYDSVRTREHPPAG